MGRPREYDSTTVLDAAMATFWERGYEATSIADLESTTGLSRSSLYQLFGNKRGVYQESLDRYMERQIAPALAAMGEPGAGLPELRTYLGMLAQAFLGDPTLAMRGCLVVNGAAELGGSDEHVKEIAVAYIHSVTDAIANALRGAATSPAERDSARDRARLMAATVMGALVMSHVDPRAAAGICRQLSEGLSPGD